MPRLTTEQLTLALIVLAAVALIGLLLVLLLTLRMRTLRRQYAILRGDGEERDMMSIISRSIRSVRDMDQRIENLSADLRDHAALTRLALQRFAVVRYNAFDDMGGQLSFSAALLDDHGDGIVVTSINGRTETRTYAKPVKALASPHNLSEEEREAIAGAVAGSGRGQSERAASSSR